MVILQLFDIEGNTTARIKKVKFESVKSGRAFYTFYFYDDLQIRWLIEVVIYMGGIIAPANQCAILASPERVDKGTVLFASNGSRKIFAKFC